MSRELDPSPVHLQAAQARRRLLVGMLCGGLLLAALWAVVELTLLRGEHGFGPQRAGMALAAACALLLAAVVGTQQCRAMNADAAAESQGPSPVLKAVAMSFLLKLFVLGAGTVVLMYSGQRVFHPFAFAITFAGASVVLQVAITWMVVKPTAMSPGVAR